MTVNVILRGHTYQLWWNQASSLNRRSIRLTSPACTLCRYQFTKFSSADNCHSLWTTVVLYGCTYISFILLVMMMQSHSLLCNVRNWNLDHTGCTLVSVLTTLSQYDVFCISNCSNSIPYCIILLSIFCLLHWSWPITLVCYIGHYQLLWFVTLIITNYLLLHVLEQHTLMHCALYKESSSCTIICICHSLLRVIIGVIFYLWITCFTQLLK